jgi:ABC-2 type transport system permease protein
MAAEPDVLREATGGWPEASREVPALRCLAWTLRRELWESRSIYAAPLAVAALIVVGSLISTFRLSERLRAAAAAASIHQMNPIAQPYETAALILMATTVIVGIFYCLDALHGERRDRSILFWKSLPVSDRDAVLAKASIPIVLLPLVTFAITVATQLVMLLIGSAGLLLGGESVAPLWAHAAPWSRWGVLFFHLVAVHGLWYAPLFAWLLLVSAWARRATFLWAALPPLAVGIVEKVAFGTTRFVHLLGTRLMGDEGQHGAGMNVDPLMPMSVWQLVTSAGLWIGLAVTALFLFATIRLRRQRGPV